VPVNRAGRLLGRRVLAAAGTVLACVLIWPATAPAEQFVVNTTVDETDVAAGDFVCFTGAEKCSLRAALETANESSGEFDEIVFDEEVFVGDGDSVVDLGSPLPTIVDPLRLASRECETAAGVPGPCAEIDGVPNARVLGIEGVEEVEIEALALTNGEVGLATDLAPRLRVRGSWFGVSLDGSGGGNETGVLLGPGSNGSRIGGEGPGTGNLIANSAGTGLQILGSSNVRVLGNELGVGPGGSQPAPNETDVAIESTVGEADAVGNAIGTRVEPEFAATPACERGCNLISGSGSNGIDLSGNGAGDPPTATAVLGNHFGLDRTGTAAVPNAEAGILVGSAPQTVIGGTKAGDSNRFAGGSAAVLAGPGAADLIARGNLIGSGISSSGAGEPPEDGIVVNSEGLSTPAVEALIADNEIGLAGGTGIAQQGFGATISGNAVHGAEIGIEAFGGEEGHGNRIEGNRIENSSANGILVENNANEVIGNEVAGAAEAGIRIAGEPPFGVFENVVGGDTAADENAIVGSGGPAIEISNVEGTQTEVALNRGSGNVGLFIDLVAADPETEPKGPNGGILPPAVAAGEANAAGTAEPGALIRVFRKQTSLQGEIESFLGQTTANEDGEWSLAFPAALPAGTFLAATQTNDGGGTSELAIDAVSGLTSGAGQSPAPPPAGPRRDKTPPRTEMLGQPKPVSHSRTARFVFASNERRSRFQCSLDGDRFRPCKSPKRYRGLQPGPHVFGVRAIDRAGNVDPTPVKRRFRILG
jgi:CSLREA domain-containing protein